MGTFKKYKTLSLVLGGDLDGCDGERVGWRSKTEEIYLYIELNHFIVQQKIIWHCKAIIFL